MLHNPGAAAHKHQQSAVSVCSTSCCRSAIDYKPGETPIDVIKDGKDAFFANGSGLSRLCHNNNNNNNNKRFYVAHSDNDTDSSDAKQLAYNMDEAIVKFCRKLGYPDSVTSTFIPNSFNFAICNNRSSLFSPESEYISH
jgi:hypothetical protein